MITQPRVTLLHMPPVDVAAAMIWAVWENAKTRHTSRTIQEVTLTVPKEQMIAHFIEVMAQDLPVAEFINMVWVVENVSRAFMDQLDRHRQAAFWEQSFRVLDLRTFFTDKGYWVSPTMAMNEVGQEIYDQAMFLAQRAYISLLEAGVPSEEARGVIPLHTNIRASFVINWRHFRRMVSSRSCFMAQGSYWAPVVRGFIVELERHGWPKELLDQMRELPCDPSGRCPVELNMRMRLTEEDLNPVCPVFVNILPEAERTVTLQLMRERFGDKIYGDIVEEYQQFLGGRALIPKGG